MHAWRVKGLESDISGRTKFAHPPLFYQKLSRNTPLGVTHTKLYARKEFMLIVWKLTILFSKHPSMGIRKLLNRPPPLFLILLRWFGLIVKRTRPRYGYGFLNSFGRWAHPRADAHIALTLLLTPCPPAARSYGMSLPNPFFGSVSTKLVTKMSPLRVSAVPPWGGPQGDFTNQLCESSLMKRTKLVTETKTPGGRPPTRRMGIRHSKSAYFNRTCAGGLSPPGNLLLVRGKDQRCPVNGTCFPPLTSKLFWRFHSNTVRPVKNTNTSMRGPELAISLPSATPFIPTWKKIGFPFPKNP